MTQNCKGLTLEGKLCSRRSKEGQKYCWQHPRDEREEFDHSFEDTLRCGALLEGGKYCPRPVAAEDMSCALHNGENENKFRRLLKKADGGSAVAQNNLGVMRLFGEGCTPNLKKAEKEFAEAARAGQPEAHTNIGVIRLQGKGEVAMNRAFESFKEAAEKGEPIAQYNLACFYDVYPDEIIAKFEYPRTLMEGGLAFGSKKSSGTIKSPSPTSRDMAIQWYRNAADNGNPLASYRLSVLLEATEEVEEAKKHLNEAAKQFVMYGRRFAAGDRYIQDLFKAYTYFLIAERLGVETKKEREPLLHILSKIQIEDAERESREILSALQWHLAF